MGNSSTSPQPSGLNRDWILGIVLFLAVILIYTPVWWAGYIWDDDAVVTGNPVVVGPLGLKEIWTTKAADICPLTLTTFWLEHKIWGNAALPYHLVNVFLHGSNAIILWQVLRKLKIPGAWLGAALWAVHPVMVESVAWITELKNTQSGLFFLLAILFYAKSLELRQSGLPKSWDANYVLTLLFAALAMTSKSSTVVLPILLCLCAWWKEGQWRWHRLLEVAPIFLFSIVMGLVSIVTQKLNGAGLSSRSWPERLVTAGDAVWFYLGKLLWPHPLVMIYPRWQVDASQGISYLPLLGVIAAWIFFWFSRKSWGGPVFFAFTFFLVALVPVMGLIKHGYSTYSFVADHFQYLASMGPLALAGAGILRGSDFLAPGNFWRRRIVVAGLLLILGTLSWQRLWVYESDTTLWADALVWNPNSASVHYNLAVALAKKGALDEAIVLYERGSQLNPDDAQIHYNLAEALTEKGRLLDEAVAHYQRAVKINPNYLKAINNLATLYVQKGRLDEAIPLFERAIALSPDEANAHNNLGVVLAQQGRLPEAEAEFKEALRLKPDYADAERNLARAEGAVKQKPNH